MQMIKKILIILGLSSCFNNFGTSHEIAINKMQLELSHAEIRRERLEKLKWFSEEIITFSLVLALFSFYMKRTEGLFMTIPMLTALNSPRILFELIRPAHDEYIMLLKKQIERLTAQEEI